MTFEDYVKMQEAGGAEVSALKILMFMLSYADPNTHIFIGSYNRISRGSDVPFPTVVATMRTLSESGLVIRVQDSHWLLDKDFFHDVDEPETDETGPAIYFKNYLTR